MKLPELKERLKNKYTVKIVAGVLIVALAAGGIGTTVYSVYGQGSDGTESTTDIVASAAEDIDLDGILDQVTINTADLDKEESVYVITDASGNSKEVIVSEHLVNKDKSATLSDETELTDIENVKGDETFTQSGNTLTWQAGGNDIYYQGKTNKAIPLKQHVTYKLDGQDITPENLAGKSGKVTIRFDYENTTSYTENIDGEDVTVKVPLAAVSTVMLNENFYNVEVTNGKVKENGSSNIVVGYALPGLKESLDVDEEKLSDVTIPDYFEITADVDNFELKTAMTFVINATEFVSLSGSMTDNIDEIVDEVNDATSQLIDGTTQLSSGADQLADGAGALADGAAQLDNGLGTLQESLAPFTTGMGSLKTGLASYLDGAKQLNDGIKSLSSGTDTLAQGVNTINSSAHSVSAGIASLDETLNTPMSDAQKSATGNAAASQAVALVDAKLQNADNPKNLANIKAAAKTAYTNKLTSDESVAAVEALIEGNDQIEAALTSAITNAVLTQEAIDNYIEATKDETGAATVTEAEAKAAILANANVSGTVSALMSTMAEGMAPAILNGVAASSADSVGSSVAGAVQDAAESTASEVAYATAISVAEQTKSTIAAGIEEEQSNGYSLVTGSRALSNGTQQLVNKVPALTTGIEQLLAGSNKLVANNNTLLKGVNDLYDGSGKIKNGVDKLADGSSELSEGASKLEAGAIKLAGGAGQLSDGMVEFNDEGITKIVNAYDGDLKPFAKRLQTIVNAGNNYQSFAGIKSGSQGSVKFIYKLGAIEAE